MHDSACEIDDDGVVEAVADLVADRGRKREGSAWTQVTPSLPAEAGTEPTKT